MRGQQTTSFEGLQEAVDIVTTEHRNLTHLEKITVVGRVQKEGLWTMFRRADGLYGVRIRFLVRGTTLMCRRPFHGPLLIWQKLSACLSLLIDVFPAKLKAV
jgi:hypothetical protein